MRTAIFIIGGLLLLAVFLFVAHFYHLPPRVALWTFLCMWLVSVVVNLTIGVLKAGYSAREELPIAALCFAIPACVTAVLLWKL